MGSALGGLHYLGAIAAVVYLVATVALGRSPKRAGKARSARR